MAMDIPTFFAGRTVLVTGGTGFMGKVLVEKMLRSLPGLRRVVLLSRSKRGMAPQARLDAMTKLPLFEKLREECPEALKKLMVVEGDIAQPELGITNPAHLSLLLSEVSVVFHMAAYLRLEAPMREAVRFNTRGTKMVLDFCKGMKQLVCFVHLSTAFCHVDVPELEERVYECSSDPLEIIQWVDRSDEETINKKTPELLGPHPNCYTFSKRLTESLLLTYQNDLPLIIVRPSIVTPSYRDPIPGWVDSLNGPIGLVVAAGKGVIRSMLCGRDFHAEVIPVDIAANALIQLAWWKSVHAPTCSELPAFNLSQSSVVRVTWGEILDTGRNLVYEYPFEGAAWYPDGDIRTSKLEHNLLVFFFQVIPAYLIDFIMFLTHQKRFMVRIQKRILVGLDVLQYFTMREWCFRNDRSIAITRMLTPSDRETFFTDNVEVDVPRYIKDTMLGARVYCMKEPLSSLPRARRHMKVLYVIHRASVLMFWLFIAWSMYKIALSLNIVPETLQQRILTFSAES